MTDRVDVEASEIPGPPTAPPPAPSSGPPEEEVYASSAVWVAVVVAAGFALFLYARWWGLLVAAGIGVMITIHELGHYLTARWTGMKATEFFLGFGPKLWSFQRGETEYGVKALPVGAYVRIIGMNNLDEVPPEDEPRTYRQQSFPRRLLVVLAGPATHFIQAAVIIFVLLAFVGVPGASVVPSDELPTERTDWVVDSVTSDSAAAAAGLQSGDRVVAFDGEPVATFEELTDHIQAAEVGQSVTLTVDRGGEVLTTETEIGGRPADLAGPDAEAGSPFLGVGPTIPDEKLGVLEALGQVPGQTLESAGAAVAAVGDFFSPSGLGNFADSVQEGSESEEEPATTSSRSSSSSSSSSDSDEGRMLSIIGAIKLGAVLGEQGALYGLLLFFLSINIFIGLLNLIPLLPFDGGHAAVAIYERIRSRGGQRYHADVTKLLPVAYAVVMALIVLGVTTMYLDVVNPVEL